MLGNLLAALAQRAGLAQRAEAPGGNFWLPERASTVAGDVDYLFNFILYVSLFFFALIVVLMVVFVVRYRRRPGVEPPPSRSHNTALELLWSGIPLLIVVYIFYVGFRTYMDMRTPPRESYEINVIAGQWDWTFKYPNGVVSSDLHVPVDQPVRLVLSSRDVIHSLFIPQFRVKMDAVPGRYNKVWFKAVTPGEFDLWCAEYCGTKHSDMLAQVVVHTAGDFEAWLAGRQKYLSDLPPAELGREIYRRNCASCHSTDGRAGTGPTFQGIWGETHRFTDGSTQLVDENYVRESILEPSKRIREGYTGQMQTFKGVLSDDDIAHIIAFIQSLK
jgi:cytochrome c oxidase subunit 2